MQDQPQRGVRLSACPVATLLEAEPGIKQDQVTPNLCLSACCSLQDEPDGLQGL